MILLDDDCSDDDEEWRFARTQTKPSSRSTSFIVLFTFISCSSQHSESGGEQIIMIMMMITILLLLLPTVLTCHTWRPDTQCSHDIGH